MGKHSSAHSPPQPQACSAKNPGSRETPSMLTQDNLQATNTQATYRSAEAIAEKWLLEMIQKCNSGQSQLPACLVSLLQHPLAPVSFLKPTEITVPILA